MTTNTIHIMDLPTEPRSCLYYYQGNFYHPVDLPGNLLGKVRGAIRTFMKVNKEYVEQDRNDPSYKTLVQLFEEQYPGE